MRNIILLSVLLLVACNDGAAMADCQKTHSHEECFYALNR